MTGCTMNDIERKRWSVSSESENKLSNEELKRRNSPTEPLPLVTCPTPEQWTELVGILASLYQVIARQHNLILEQSKTLENISSALYALARQMEKTVQDLSTIRWEVEQAGSKKERKHLRLPRLHLPELPMVTFKGVALTLMILTALGALLYALATLWSVIKPLLQPLP